MFKEFKEFAVKGNVVDMAIGIIIGTAFGKIVTSLVSDIVMPPLSFLLGKVNFSSLAITLKSASETAPAISINYGLFINTILDFVIIAFAIFIVIKQLNKLKRKEAVQSVEPSEEVLLLREIRDQLKKSSPVVD